MVRPVRQEINCLYMAVTGKGVYQSGLKEKLLCFRLQGEPKIWTGENSFIFVKYFYFPKIDERLMSRTGKRYWAVMRYSMDDKL